ncbi:hypothetical protein GCM10010191_84970 [Actinomadura vinacea]|uniref:Uncharacterized protein n=1 Tax=Actinomadura vinacea TaxID=115336 RepID=A0ABN3KDE9_9ACTN
MAAELWQRLLASLERPCAACGGTGSVLSGDWKAWHERAGELIRVAQAAQRATTLQSAAGRGGAPPAGGAVPAGGPGGGGAAQGNGVPGGTVPGSVPQAFRETTPQGVPQMAPAGAHASAVPGARPVAPGPPVAGQPVAGPAATGPVVAGPAAAPQPGAARGEPGAAWGEPATAPAIVTAIDRAIDDHVRTRPSGPERVPCEACEGCGRALTAAGAGLTDFLARHGLVWADPGLNGRGGQAVQPGDGPFPTSP